MSKEEAVKKLEHAFSIGADISAACFYANISRQTYYNYIDEDSELKERFDNLREKPALMAYDTIFNNLNDKETAKWYLERKKKTEFSTKTEVDNTHHVDKIEGFNFIMNKENDTDHRTDNQAKSSVD